MEQKSVFELILSGELDSEIIYEDDEIFAINDINPVAKVHILIIPKRNPRKGTVKMQLGLTQ